MLRMKSLCGVYVGWESRCNEPQIVSKAWFRELADPWRVGHGVRFRIGHKAIQVGRCRPNTEGDMSALRQLGGRELRTFRPEEIGRWDGQGVRTKEPEAG
jgi:hypothetical protein